jgi:hypothetical protein
MTADGAESDPTDASFTYDSGSPSVAMERRSDHNTDTE